MAQLRLGISGLGRGAMLTVPGLAANARIELVAGFDPSREPRLGLRRAYGVRAYESFDALIAHPDLDAVYIASPHGHHASQAIAAARAGKHVLVEKPMAVSIAEARAMADAAAESGTCLMVGPSHGFDGPVSLAADIIASGNIGRARMIQAFNYTDFLLRPRRPEELDRERGGGVVLSQATHQIDIVRRLAGSKVRSIRAQLFDWDVERPADGAFSAFLFFENGATATLGYSGYAHYDSDALLGWVDEMGMPKARETHARARSRLASTDEAAQKQARGFAGSASSADETIVAHEHFGFVLASCEKADIELTASGVILHGDTSREELAVPLPETRRTNVGQAFAACVLDGEAPIFDGAWGLHTLACCQAILRSGDEGREVMLDEIVSESR
ncbi:MAG: Gfo/Idh/MocA family protein [Parasphingopyxis sp.]